MVRQAQGARNISDARALPIDTDQITDTDFLAGFLYGFWMLGFVFWGFLVLQVNLISISLSLSLALIFTNSAFWFYAF